MAIPTGFVLSSTSLFSHHFKSFPRRRLGCQIAIGPRMAAKEAGASTSAIPSLEEIRKRHSSIDFVNGPLITSPSTQWEAVRLFNGSEQDIRVVLYRDHASWCPYCHKVQLLLEAKRVPYRVKKENMSCYGKKSESFLKMVPSGLLPVVEIDGEVITESRDIMFFIEQKFQSPYRQMIPTDDDEKMQAFHRYIRLEGVFVGSWLPMLRSPLAQIGLAKQPFLGALDLMDKSLDEFEGSFFLGNEPSFVDIYFSSMLERAYSSVRYWRDIDITKERPNLRRWFNSMSNWPAARNMMSDDLTHVLALPPQIGDVKFSFSRSAFSHKVETARTLHMLNDGSERAFQRSEAAQAVLRNHDAVVNDIMKKSGTKTSKDVVEIGLRAVLTVLTNPDDLEILEAAVKEEISNTSELGTAMRFLRGRCCAPRDMSVDALGQFCGAINWFLDTVDEKRE